MKIARTFGTSKQKQEYNKIPDCLHFYEYDCQIQVHCNTRAIQSHIKTYHNALNADNFFEICLVMISIKFPKHIIVWIKQYAYKLYLVSMQETIKNYKRHVLW